MLLPQLLTQPSLIPGTLAPYPPPAPQTTLAPYPPPATQTIPAQYINLYSLSEQARFTPVVPSVEMVIPKVRKITGTKLEKNHDRWHNMNEIVVENIRQTALWKNELGIGTCETMDAWREQVQEHVTDLDPITLDKKPSTGWCYLYKLCQLTPSQEEVEEMIHTDEEPIQRGLVFVYLRMVVPSKRLWYWFSRYLHEKTLVQRDYKRTCTIGEFLISLLRDSKYSSVHIDFSLPRISVPVHRAYRTKLYMMELIQRENELFRKDFQLGVNVLALYHDDQEYYRAKIVDVLENGNFWIRFEEYGSKQEISLGQMKWIKEEKGKSSSSRSPSREKRSRGSSKRKPKRWRSRRSSSRSDSTRRRRSISRSRGKRGSSSRSSRGRRHKAPDYKKFDEYIARKIRKEDSEGQSSSNPRNCTRRVLGEKESMKTATMFQNCREIGGINQFVVDMPQNREVVRVRRQEYRDRERDEKILRENEKNWKPSKRHQEKLAKLKERYG